MLYFEDALWIRENFWKNAIGTSYFVLGFFGIAFHLVLVSILPEIANFISHPSTVLLSAQFTACIVQFFVVFVPVPAMIAVNKPYFLNPVMINVPPFLLVLSQSFAFLFMMINGIYRNLKSTFPRTGTLIFVNKVVFLIIIFTFFFSFYFAVNICAHTTIRRFNPPELVWNLQEFEEKSFQFLAIVVVIISSISNLLSLSIIFYRKLFEKQRPPVEDETEPRRETIISTIFYTIYDCFFAFLICIGFVFTSPLLSITQVFLTAYWPVITALSLDVHIRSALIYRLRGIFQPHSANTPIVIRANTSKFTKF